MSLSVSLLSRPHPSVIHIFHILSAERKYRWVERRGGVGGWTAYKPLEFSNRHVEMERHCVLLLLLSTLVYCSLGQGGDLSLPASLSVSPDRSQFFEYESVSLSCEVQGNSARWRVVRNTERGILSECNTDWGKQQGSSCIVSLIPSDSGVYWCVSGSGEHSNAVNITVHAGAVILESPALPVTGGDSVTLRCRYQGTSSNLTAVFYKDGSLIRTETTGEMTIPAVSKSDEGLYKCTNSEGESPESWMTVTDLSLPASLIVSPDRSQFFEYESVSLSCEVQGNSAGWRVVRNTTRGILSECNTDWGKQQGSSCIVSLILSDSGVYWCESGSGEHSNAVNITVHAAGPTPIPSPAVPVLSMSLPRLLCSLLVGSPYLLVTIILLVKYCRSRAQGETRVPRKTHQDQLGDHVEEE
ncbi:high affinity immunoglobulin gamma Fc receptor I-like isoform X2 [Salmo salar]|uniref:high affinity immunoglobulin gamma Fc receptor I-like isoform X2 n=1 Tax=Salmo salar TaxID=8030 RepID=UPI001E669FAC|nr:high affinity immunoglobulin gamma Fc receptor I-like isoform X2 [Salmo salar]